MSDEFYGFDDPDFDEVEEEYPVSEEHTCAECGAECDCLGNSDDCDLCTDCIEPPEPRDIAMDIPARSILAAITLVAIAHKREKRRKL